MPTVHLTKETVVGCLLAGVAVAIALYMANRTVTPMVDQVVAQLGAIGRGAAV